MLELKLMGESTGRQFVLGNEDGKQSPLQATRLHCLGNIFGILDS
jgi:hypothetical protein